MSSYSSLCSTFVSSIKQLPRASLLIVIRRLLTTPLNQYQLAVALRQFGTPSSIDPLTLSAKTNRLTYTRYFHTR